MQYDHKAIEKKWQEEWATNKIYTTPDKVPGKDNFYLLVELPYPSGNLHVGHWYAFAVPDMLARMLRMQGKNVMYPIGFDAFGLPAENAAIKNKVNPAIWTEGNIEYMKGQIRSMGTMFDWSREVVTCRPDYYKWTQWLFLQMHKHGLVYQKETAVNWCPKDLTVLANEQVVDGACERCSSVVEQRLMLQWNIKITKYADRLIDDLEGMDWPQQIKESQKNWIGRSEGAEIDFRLDIPDESMKRVILLHGKGGTADGALMQWARGELEKSGYEVEVPQLPNTTEPDDIEQAEYIKNNCTIDEHTILVGHSAGGLAAMRLLESTKAGRLVLVATPFKAKFLDGKERPTIARSIERGYDFARIRANVQGVLALYDVGDPIVPIEDGESYAKAFDTFLMRGNGTEGHFNAAKEPDLLMAIMPTIRVFTTRPDTLFGATYLVLAPDHQWVTLALGHKTVLKNNAEVQAYVDQTKRKTELERQADQKEKTGVKLEGVTAINPATGEKIPMYVADYVLASYGTGAIMAVPAHDERDGEFAKKFNIPITEVVEPLDVRTSGLDAFHTDEPVVERNAVMAVVKHWEQDKYLCLKWNWSGVYGFVTGGIEEGEDPVQTAIREIEEETGYSSAEYVRSLGTRVHAKFYAGNKMVNRFAHFTPLLFKLKDGSHSEVSEKESSIHVAEWFDADEVMEKLNRHDFKLVWQRVNDKTTYTGEGLLVNSGEFDGMATSLARSTMTEKYGRAKKTYRLRDWIVSRQRYWGVPIPMIHCEKCGIVPVAEEQLPVLLPETDDYLPEGTGKSPLAKVDSFVNVACPACGGAARRETDTLDTFVDSSWYYHRYIDPKNTEAFADPAKLDAWMPIDLYSGGAEHTTVHVLYSRFWQKAFFDMGLLKDAEPFTRRMNRSLIMGPDGQKMSKSRGNVIDPDEVVERLGADTVRMYLAFIGPYNEVASYPWNPDGVVGIRRFLERVGRAEEFVQDAEVAALNVPLHKAIKKVGEDGAALKFNTAISQLMILLNAIEKEKAIGRAQWETFLKLLAPFAPHMAEEMWSLGGKKDSIHLEPWPQFEEKHLVEDTVMIAIQINGKTRGEVQARYGDDTQLEALAREVVAAKLEGHEIVRTIVVSGRLVNFVLKH